MFPNVLYLSLAGDPGRPGVPVISYGSGPGLAGGPAGLLVGLVTSCQTSPAMRPRQDKRKYTKKVKKRLNAYQQWQFHGDVPWRHEVAVVFHRCAGEISFGERGNRLWDRDAAGSLPHEPEPPAVCTIPEPNHGPSKGKFLACRVTVPYHTASARDPVMWSRPYGGALQTHG